MLLLNHPLDCPICDKAGECTLQNYYMEHDLQPGRQDFTRFRKEKAKDIGPTLILDQERCVLCDRCVRFLRDVAKEEQLYIAGRGHEAYITTFPGQEVTSPYSMQHGGPLPGGRAHGQGFSFQLGHVVPEEHRFGVHDVRAWLQHADPDEEGPGLSACGRGSTRAVNGYWACDEGRVNYQFVNHDRIVTPFIRRGDDGIECSMGKPIAEMRALLGFKPAGQIDNRPRGARVVALASATCTLEEMFLLDRLAKECLNAPVFVARHVPDGVDDHLLRRADKHPNARGAEMLGLRVVDLQRGGVERSSQASSAATVCSWRWASIRTSRPSRPCGRRHPGHRTLGVPLGAHRSRGSRGPGPHVRREGRHDRELRRHTRSNCVPRCETKAETEWRIIDAMIASLVGDRRRMRRSRTCARRSRTADAGVGRR